MPRVTITVPEKTPQPYRFQLDRRSVTLGRGSENDIAIDSGSVSVKHAEMVRVDGGYELRDVGSTNGIKLDDERREVIRLKNGMSVKIGDVDFDFLLADEELEALSHEKPAESSPIEKLGGDSPGLPRLPEAPAPEPASQRPIVITSDSGGGGGAGMVLLFLILAAAAFVAGMAIRFQKDTGGSWLDAVKSKGAAPTAPASPAGK